MTRHPGKGIARRIAEFKVVEHHVARIDVNRGAGCFHSKRAYEIRDSGDAGGSR